MAQRSSQAGRSHPVVVLGASGFIGGAIARHLGTLGRPVIPASSRECDLLVDESCAAFFAGIPNGADMIVASAITRSVRDSREAMLANIRMAEAFVRHAGPAHPRSLVYLSSVDVYGRTPPVPLTEESPVAPEGYYGTSKLATEEILSSNATLVCPIAILRLGGVYGCGDNGRSVVGRMVRSALDEGRITVSGNGGLLRDYVALEDVRAVVRHTIDQASAGVFNVATGTSVSIDKLAAIIAEAVGGGVTVERQPADRAAAGDLVFDTARLRREMPNHTFVPIQSGVTQYVSAVR